MCPACCSGVGVGQGVGEEGVGKEPLTGRSKHWGPFHLLRSQLMPDEEWPGPPAWGLLCPAPGTPPKGGGSGALFPACASLILTAAPPVSLEPQKGSQCPQADT